MRDAELELFDPPLLLHILPYLIDACFWMPSFFVPSDFYPSCQACFSPRQLLVYARNGVHANFESCFLLLCYWRVGSMVSSTFIAAFQSIVLQYRYSTTIEESSCRTPWLRGACGLSPNLTSADSCIAARNARNNAINYASTFPRSPF